MECPYCGSEMISGYITVTGGGFLAWVTRFHKSMIRQIFRNDHETFTKDLSYVKTYKCEACNKIIIDLNDDLNRLNKS